MRPAVERENRAGIWASRVGGRMSTFRGRAVAALAPLPLVWIIVGCGDAAPMPIPAIETPQPVAVVIPPGIVTTGTADRYARLMLDEIAASERKLGRSLAPARIVRIQLLRPDETYWGKHFDGTNPGGFGMSPDGGPGWIVEAVGTFIGEDPRTGRIDSLGMHGFHLWGDAGGESWGFIPCRVKVPVPAAELEGTC